MIIFISLFLLFVVFYQSILISALKDEIKKQENEQLKKEKKDRNKIYSNEKYVLYHISKIPIKIKNKNKRIYDLFECTNTYFLFKNNLLIGIFSRDHKKNDLINYLKTPVKLFPEIDEDFKYQDFKILINEFENDNDFQNEITKYQLNCSKDAYVYNNDILLTTAEEYLYNYLLNNLVNKYENFIIIPHLSLGEIFDTKEEKWCEQYYEHNRANINKYHIDLALFYKNSFILGIEMDGYTHIGFQKELDDFKNYIFEKNNLSLLRFKNTDIFDIEYVYSKIQIELKGKYIKSICPKCNNNLIIQSQLKKNELFIGCSGFYKSQKCTYSKDIKKEK